MIRIGLVALIGFLLTFGLPFRAEAEHMPPGPQGKLVLGWLEKIILKPWDIVLRAKLDTGANTASIDAEAIRFFKKDQQKWVRFWVVQNKRNDKPNHKFKIERPLVRTVFIRDHLLESQQRPVVTLEFCLHGMVFETEFNLVNRSNFNYPILLGRRFLEKVALVDAEATLLTHTNLKDCKEPEDVSAAKDETGEIHRKAHEPSNSPRRAETETGELSTTVSTIQGSRRLVDKKVSSRREIAGTAEGYFSGERRRANRP